MGKTKQPPEQPVKIVRSLGENLSIIVSEEEKKYRNRNGPGDVKDIKKNKLKCTVCTKSVADVVRKGLEPFVHMVLGVLVCKDCSSFYGDGYFSVDEDGDDKYCRWCGQGGTLYICSTCSCAFCKKCIKQNLEKQDVKDLESDDWQCFICNPKPIYECRTICWTLQEYAEKLKKKDLSEDEENLASLIKSRKDRSNQSSGTKSNENLSNTKKRRASISEEVGNSDTKGENKRRKISEPKNEEMSQETTNLPPRRSRSSRGHEMDTEFSRLTKNETRSRGSCVTNEEEKSPSKKLSHNSKKKDNKNVIEEITISDEEYVPKAKKTPSREITISDEEYVPKAKKTQSRKKSVTKTNSSSFKKSRDIGLDSTNDEVKETRLRRSAGKNTKESSFKKSSEEMMSKTPKKQIKNKNVRKSKGKTKQKKYLSDESEENSMEFESHKGELSAVECEKKLSDRNTKCTLTKYNKNLLKIQLSIGNDVDNNVIDGCGYVNAAIKDVTELSVLINSHCERLCSKIVRNSDDVLKSFHKLKELMGGVTSNLETIGKGLDNKISKWNIMTSEGDTHSEEYLEIKSTVDDNLHNDVVEGSSNEVNFDKSNLQENFDEQSKSTNKVTEKNCVTNDNNKTADPMEIESILDYKDDEKCDGESIDLMEEESSHKTNEDIKKDNSEPMEVDVLENEKLTGDTKDISIIDGPSKMCDISENEIELECNTDKVVLFKESNQEENIEKREENEYRHAIDSDIKEQLIQSEGNHAEDSPGNVSLNHTSVEINSGHLDEDELNKKTSQESNDVDENKASECYSDSEDVNREIKDNNKLCDKSINNVSENEKSCKTNLYCENTSEDIQDINDFDEIGKKECLSSPKDVGVVNSLAVENCAREPDISKNSINKNIDLQENICTGTSSNDLPGNINKEETSKDFNYDKLHEKKDKELNKLTENINASEYTIVNNLVKETSPEEMKNKECSSSEPEEKKNCGENVEKKDSPSKVNELSTTNIKKRVDEEEKAVKPSKDQPKPISSTHPTETPRCSSGNISFQGSQRWSGERNRDWNHQKRYSGDRDRRSSGGHPGSWNRYDDRWHNRSGWGWTR